MQADIAGPGLSASTPENSVSTYRLLERCNAAGIPTIAVVFGNATAGGAYIPGMSDYTVFVADQAKVFLAGPPLVNRPISIRLPTSRSRRVCQQI